VSIVETNDAIVGKRTLTLASIDFLGEDFQVTSSLALRIVAIVVLAGVGDGVDSMLRAAIDTSVDVVFEGGTNTVREETDRSGSFRAFISVTFSLGFVSTEVNTVSSFLKVLQDGDLSVETAGSGTEVITVITFGVHAVAVMVRVLVNIHVGTIVICLKRGEANIGIINGRNATVDWNVIRAVIGVWAAVGGVLETIKLDPTIRDRLGT